MRTILKVVSGIGAEQKAVFGAGQTLQVGRTQWADFAFPGDGRMSGVHFALETDNENCYIRDLGSRNGTMLNDKPLAERTRLRHGDQIRAGDTTFQVLIEGEQPASPEIAPTGIAPPARNTAEAAIPMPLPAAEAPPRRGNVAFTLETCSSGLALCQGEVAQIRPADLANLLGRKIPLYFIADIKKTGLAPPDDRAAYDYLFDWLAPETAPLASPIVLAQSQYPDWPAVVEHGWGNDALVGLFTQYARPGLMEHLRHCLRAKPKGDDLSAGIIGFCWPSVMSMLLAYGSPKFNRQLLTGIEAVMVELPDLPTTWQIYGSSRIAGLLEDLGFVRQSWPETKQTS